MPELCWSWHYYHSYIEAEIITEIGILTNLTCNKNCKHCAFEVQTSKYEGLSIDDYENIIYYFGDTSQIKSVVLCGGETLMYEHYRWTVERILYDFPNAVICTVTNGKLLPEYDDMINERCTFNVTVYPNWNDDIIKKYKDNQFCYIKPYRGFFDYSKLPHMSEKEAQKAWSKCYRIPWFMGDRLYACCYSHVLEKKLGWASNTSVLLSQTWRKDFEHLSDYKLCARCPRGTEQWREGCKNNSFPKEVRLEHE